MGDGLLTILPVMGTALIRAAGISKTVSGALLLVEDADRPRLPVCRVSDIEDKEVLSIDWIHSEPTGVRELQEGASLSTPGALELEKALSAYCKLGGRQRGVERQHQTFLGASR